MMMNVKREQRHRFIVTSEGFEQMKKIAFYPTNKTVSWNFFHIVKASECKFDQNSLKNKYG